MSTPHNKAKEGVIAKTVLMPGDPLRAKYIAENFLDDVEMFNDVRNMFGYTGYYKGKKVSVMGSGMGMPSLGIYAYELFQMYGVESIIRVGSCGSYQEDVHIRDVIIAQAASTNSNFASQYNLPGTFCPVSSWELIRKAVEEAEKRNVKYHVGTIFSSDIFYSADSDGWKKWAEMGCLAVEMETYALLAIASHLKKKALTILTVSDSLVTFEETTAEQREKTFNEMMEIALEVA